MDAINSVFNPFREFAKDRLRLAKKCHKLDRKRSHEVVALLAERVPGTVFVGVITKLVASGKQHGLMYQLQGLLTTNFHRWNKGRPGAAYARTYHDDLSNSKRAGNFPSHKLHASLSTGGLSSVLDSE